MALGGVFMKDTDGNIGTEVSSRAEKVCGLLFDISGQADFWSSGYPATVAGDLQNTVVELNSLQDAIDAGIKPYDADTDAAGNFLHGIPYYHIKHFFDVSGGSGRLFVMFADCSTTFNAIIEMQRAASGLISQFGVWTEQYLWSHIDPTDPAYAIRLVGDLDPIAQSLANDYNAPCVILLNANSAKVLGATTTEMQYSYTPVTPGSGVNPQELGYYKSDGDGGYTAATETSVDEDAEYYTRSGTEVTSTAVYTTVDVARIPTCVIGKRYVSVLLGQGVDNDVSAMQCALDSKTPVGNVGAALGILSIASVSESIGWVQYYDLAAQFPGVEFGFGDATLTSGRLTDPTSYKSLSQSQIDAIDDKGYVFLCTYSDYEGHVFFNDDGTCSDGDYRTIARNRVINKSRRLVRKALLKYVNSPVKVDPSTGTLSAAQITIFNKEISDALNMMVNAGEASGIGQVSIPANQNILKNDTLNFSYTLVPIGTAKGITVNEGLVLKQ